MEEISTLKSKILALNPSLTEEFNQLAMQIFHLQYKHCAVYKEFCELLGIRTEQMQTISDIPFLPITFFKNYNIQTQEWEPEHVFKSSGTSGSVRSRHLVRSLSWYHQICLKGFTEQYGQPAKYGILGLLPSYADRADSSLISMVAMLQKESGYETPQFFLHEYEQLNQAYYLTLESGKIPFIIGVTFALLEWAEKKSLLLKDCILMETGGMKGRKEELVRSAVHQSLQNAFGLTAIHSEYGMTELFSQAYSSGDGIFKPSSTLRVYPRRLTDPLSSGNYGVQAAINCIDLGNIDTCSFIATDDVGKIYTDGRFEILGRMDQSDVRGCNLMFAGGA